MPASYCCNASAKTVCVQKVAIPRWQTNSYKKYLVGHTYIANEVLEDVVAAVLGRRERGIHSVVNSPAQESVVVIESSVTAEPVRTQEE